MECDFGNAIASMPQSGNWLENRRSQDDEVSRRMWKAVETEAGEIKVAETERRGDKRKSRKRMRRKEKSKGGKTEKTKKGKNDRYKKDSGRMRDMGRRERSSKVRGGG